jgi:hypothetical protein
LHDREAPRAPTPTLSFGRCGPDLDPVRSDPHCKTYILHHYRFIDQFGRPDRWDLEASSWINNQTGGVAATLRNRNGATFKAPIVKDKFLNPPWNDRVVRVKPC